MTVPLPPLPPAADDAYRPGGRSLADIVDREHRALLDLAEQVTDAGSTAERRREVLDVLTAAVSRHLSAEEQYLFPAARAAVPESAELVDREIEADAALLTALKELSGVDDAALADVADRVARHVSRVTALVTPLRQVATDAELIRLGNRWEIAEEAAPTRPHPGTPATPPWNKIVEPAVGVLDKVRDAVTGRRTQLSDLERPPGR
ncbi:MULTISPECIES: hemerythrin domain-containing protein [Micromonospora]|uniref:Hemerythrin domain-containing protein n=1 Tax=Micromonospora solifontis TaxID=2487138 RepID=A0ABX9W990_9ACTN|nr:MULTISPECIES: hemerythrin domain-containing protein [Micromonospora]NES13083.1 hemerythrin domain-containing protein [Micromonospora sp. PPF5-17B]NES39411.1 hemerythrin domain-containing protein [Micromonospora solifontis]NES55008.1 hemerythrin domain-containing protein [Micromonospora sp. PPF5-6]RNL89023.1 hemerythrin domain-containing protein [Micromonospora solifontis]